MKNKIIKTLSLTEEEVKLLKELLATDLDKVGFEDNEIDILDEVYKRLIKKDK